MEVKVVISLDERTASLLENLINALGSHIVQQIAPVEALPSEEPKLVWPAEEQANAPIYRANGPKEEKPTADLNSIRTIARKLADEGRQTEYKEILKDFGYEKVNQIKEEDYQAVYDEMAALVETK